MRPKLSLRVLLCCMAATGCAGQKVDTDFKPRLAQPAYTSNAPLICIDEGHNNSHTAGGLYRPFAELMQADGYRIERSKSDFRTSIPSRCAALVVVNAAGGKTYKLFGLNLPTESRKHRPKSAFTSSEIAAIRDWVERGGSMLLVADHYPFGSAASALAQAFGVNMSGGFTEAANVDPARPHDRSRLIYSRENGLLGDHPITRGRGPNEIVTSVVTFTGQSLGSSSGTALLVLGDSAVDFLPAEPTLRSQSATGRSQAVALNVGRGRVVVMGEAAALTAQVDDRGIRFGMQLPNIGNQQFALNIMHWLTRLL